MGEILYYAMIFPLEQVLGFILGLLFKLTQSHGASIVILSFLVNIFMLKLFLYTDRKAASESALKAKLDSRIKAWKSVYKKAKLYAFTQTLYKQHNYHPIYALRSLGGLALQIPFFYAMYELIKGATYLSGVSFLWITDLSKPDSITLLDFSIHLLPILMTLFTLINVFYSSKELGARIQGSVIALLFLVLLYSMPSALVLYWTCNMVFALVKEVIKARFGDSSLTQSFGVKGSGEGINPFLRKNENGKLDSEASKDISATPQYDKVSESSMQANTHTQDSLYTIIKLTIISLCLMIFLYNPYNLYSSDLYAFDLDSIPLTLSALFGFFALVSLLLIYIFSFLNGNNKFSKTIMAFFAWFFVSVLLLAVSYNFILRGDYGVMSYFLFEKIVSASPTQKLIDYIMMPASLLLAIPLLIWLQKYIVQANKILMVVLVIGSSIPFIETMAHIAKRTEAQGAMKEANISQANGLLDFAKDHKNILVLILDRSDGYVAHEIFKQYPKLSESFQGFIDFTQGLSAAGMTLPTLTSIIAGEYYKASEINARNINDGLANEIARGYASTLNTFNKNGYAVSAILDFPTNEVSLYPLLDNRENILFDTTSLSNDFTKRHLLELNTSKLPIMELISYGVFQISTFKLRRDVYKYGAWLLGSEINAALKSTAEFHALMEQTTNNATQPTFKFIHNSITHSPYGTNIQCKLNNSEIYNKLDDVYGVPEGHYNSEKCAWHFVAQMLERLQELGVYDNTEIFITSDHGAQSKFLPIHQGLHIPFFYKPFNAKAAMKQDNRIITNYDIPTIFCENLKNGCPNVIQNILANIQKRTIQTYDMNNWTIESQNKNSFKLKNFHIFDGTNIYDKSAWHKIEVDSEISQTPKTSKEIPTASSTPQISESTHPPKDSK